MGIFSFLFALAVAPLFTGFHTTKAYEIDLYDKIIMEDGAVELNRFPFRRMKSNGCRNFPKYIISRTHAIRILNTTEPEYTGSRIHPNCAQFYDQLNCSGMSTQLSSHDPSASQDQDQYDNFDVRKIKSVGPCEDPFSNSNQGQVEEGLYIMLFMESDFRGEKITIALNFTDCFNLSNGNYKDWKGFAMSMRVANGRCLELFKGDNCMNLEFMTSQTEVQNFADFNFERKIRIRSLHVCNKHVEETTTPEVLSRSMPLYSLLIVASLCVSIAFVPTLLLIRNRKQTKKLGKTSQEKLTDKEINEFLQGLGLQLEEINEESESNDWNNEEVEVQDDSAASKLSSDLLAQNQAYNKQLEIPLTQLKFGKQDAWRILRCGSIPRHEIMTLFFFALQDAKYPIGSGEYGNVFKGKLERSDEESITVAIKTPKSNSNIQYLRALLKEVKTMMYVGPHSKIVALIGCSTVNLRESEIFIVLEYCEKGSLENFLKANRSRFVNFVQKGQLQAQTLDADLDNDLNSQPTNPSYVQVLPSLHSLTHPDCNTFDIRQMLTWIIAIAEGMEYLSMKKVVHGDLSARNILLTSDLTAKVSDFGLSRKIYCYSPYTKNGEEPLPWRWLALESLKNLEFSTASDVWSFGILLWEIFTLGEQPYPGVSSLTNNFIVNLEQGLRPVLPPLATCDIYNIMSCCWNDNPTLRPTFSRLISSFQEIEDVYQNQLSFEAVTSL